MNWPVIRWQEEKVSGLFSIFLPRRIPLMPATWSSSWPQGKWRQWPGVSWWSMACVAWKGTSHTCASQTYVHSSTWAERGMMGGAKARGTSGWDLPTWPIFGLQMGRFCGTWNKITTNKGVGNTVDSSWGNMGMQEMNAYYESTNISRYTCMYVQCFAETLFHHEAIRELRVNIVILRLR